MRSSPRVCTLVLFIINQSINQSIIIMPWVTDTYTKTKKNKNQQKKKRNMEGHSPGFGENGKSGERKRQRCRQHEPRGLPIPPWHPTYATCSCLAGLKSLKLTCLEPHTTVDQDCGGVGTFNPRCACAARVTVRAEEIMLNYLNFILLLDSSIMCNLCSYFYQIRLEILNTV